jgi:phage pi2 protein 07
MAKNYVFVNKTNRAELKVKASSLDSAIREVEETVKISSDWIFKEALALLTLDKFLDCEARGK